MRTTGDARPGQEARGASTSRRRRAGDPFPSTHGDEILYVDFVGRRPHSIITTKATYDVEWSKARQTLYFSDVGSGMRRNAKHPVTCFCDPSNTSFWAADSLDLRIHDEWDHDARRYKIDVPATAEELAKRGITRRTRLRKDPFEDAVEADGHIEYCTVCEDFFPDGDGCGHFWASRDGLTVGPGADDQNNANDCKEPFLRFVAVAGIARRLRDGLVPFVVRHSQLHATGGLGPSFVNVSIGRTHIGDIAHKFDQYDDRLSDGAAWFLALDAKTLDANARTRSWLDDLIAEQNARRASGGACYVVREDDEYVTTPDRAEPRWSGSDELRMICDGVFGTTSQRRAVRLSWQDALATRAKIRTARPRAAVAIVFLRKRGSQ